MSDIQKIILISILIASAIYAAINIPKGYKNLSNIKQDLDLERQKNDFAIHRNIKE